MSGKPQLDVTPEYAKAVYDLLPSPKKTLAELARVLQREGFKISRPTLVRWRAWGWTYESKYRRGGPFALAQMDKLVPKVGMLAQLKQAAVTGQVDDGLEKQFPGLRDFLVKVNDMNLSQTIYESARVNHKFSAILTHLLTSKAVTLLLEDPKTLAELTKAAGAFFSDVTQATASCVLASTVENERKVKVREAKVVEIDPNEEDPLDKMIAYWGNKNKNAKPAREPVQSE